MISHLINGVLIGLLYALIAMGFVIIYRSGRVFNLAQGEIVMFGAFLIWTFCQFFGLPMWISLPLAFLASLLLGLLIERIILRPLIGEELFALFMVTVGLMVFLRGLALIIWGAEVRFIPPVFSMKGVKVGSILMDRGLLIGAGMTVLIAPFISLFFNHTRLGMEMTAVAEDHQIALSLGINVKRSISASWAISGVLCTLAAMTFLSGKGMTFQVADVGLVALPVALLAGLESIGGLVLAGLLFGISIGLAEYYLNPVVQGGVSTVFPFIIMVIILLIRPTGLFGWRTIERI